MRRIVALCTAVVCLVAGGSSVAAGPARALFPWSGDATMVAGTTTYSSGEFIYTDFVFDDTGPSGRADDIAGLGVTAPAQASDTIGRGYAEYPHDWDRFGDNAADLVEVRVTADASDVYYLFRLNTLMVADSTVIGLAVDEDNAASSGGGAWPFGANVVLGGWERLYTVWGTGATVTAADGTSTDLRDVGGEVRVDLDENLIEARVPRAVADPGTGAWRMSAAAGLWDPDGGRWLAFAPLADAHSPGIRYAGATLAGRVPNVFNIAFRSIDETDDFGTDRQAAALTAGDISAFGTEVDFAKVAAGSSDPPLEPPVGRYTRIYRSRLSGEGIVDLRMRPCYEAISADHQPRRHPTCQEYYLSRYQPYNVYVPTSYKADAPNPLVVTSHGYNEYYGPDIEFVGGYDAIDRNGAVTAFALGRGQGTMYLRAAEFDVLEVIADVKRRYAIDADRVSAVGASHGGLFVWLMATLHPDVFSAGLPVIPGYIKHGEFGTENDVVLNAAYVPLGSEGDRLQHVAFKVTDLFENLRNVPIRVLTGDQDPASPPGRYELMVTDRLAELGYDYIHFGCSLHTHGPSSATLGQELLDWLIQQTRPEAPRFVVYKGNTGADAWNEPWGNQHDSAYWVRDIRFADPARPFVIEAESQAIQDVIRTPRPISGVNVYPADAPPSVCHHKGMALDGGAELPVSNALDVKLSNVASLMLEADRAALSLTGGLRLDVSTDRATLVSITGLSPQEDAWVDEDGAPHPSSVDGASISFRLLSGRHTYTLHG